MTTDFSIFGEPLEHMTRTAQYDGIRALPIAAQHVILVCGAFGPVVNGGFEFFYEAAFWDEREGVLVERTAQAFLAVGLLAGAGAVRTSATFFPAGILEAGPGEVSKYLATQPEANAEAFFDPLDRTVWSLNDDGALDRALQKYGASQGLLTYRRPHHEW